MTWLIQIYHFHQSLAKHKCLCSIKNTRHFFECKGDKGCICWIHMLTQILRTISNSKSNNVNHKMTKLKQVSTQHDTLTFPHQSRQCSFKQTTFFSSMSSLLQIYFIWRQILLSEQEIEYKPRRMTQEKEWLLVSLFSFSFSHKLASLSCVICTSSPCGTWAMCNWPCGIWET